MSARGRRAVIKAARRKNHRLDRQTHVRSELPNLARDGDADRAGRREWRGTRRDPESNPQHAIRSPQQRVNTSDRLSPSEFNKLLEVDNDESRGHLATVGAATARAGRRSSRPRRRGWAAPTVSSTPHAGECAVDLLSAAAARARALSVAHGAQPQIMLVIFVLAAVPPMLFLSIAHEHHASRQPEASTQLGSVSRAALQGVESVRHGVENVQGIIGMLPRLWHREDSQAEASATGHCVACHRLRLFVAISSELSEAGFRRRRMQRNTWIRWAHNSSVSDALEYRFFVRHDAAAQTAAHEEDLVRLQLPSASSSRLPLWTLEMLQTAWALEHDFDFAFILHIADHGFLCIHRVTEELRYRPTERFVWAKYECDGNVKKSEEDAAPKLVPGFLLLSRDVADFTHRAYARMRRSASSAAIVAPLPLQAFFLLLNLAILDDQHRIVQFTTTIEYLNEWHQKSSSSSLRRTSTGPKPPAAHFCKRFVWGGDMVNHHWEPPNATTAFPPPRLAGPSAAAARVSANLGQPRPAQLLPMFNQTRAHRGGTSTNSNATARTGLAESPASSWWTMFSSTHHFGEAAAPSREGHPVTHLFADTTFSVLPSQAGLDGVYSMTRMTLSLMLGTREPSTASMAARKTRSRDLPRFHSIWPPIRISKQRYPLPPPATPHRPRSGFPSCPLMCVHARPGLFAVSRAFRRSRKVPSFSRFRKVRTWTWFSRR